MYILNSAGSLALLSYQIALVAFLVVTTEPASGARRVYGNPSHRTVSYIVLYVTSSLQRGSDMLMRVMGCDGSWIELLEDHYLSRCENGGNCG